MRTNRARNTYSRRNGRSITSASSSRSCMNTETPSQLSLQDTYTAIPTEYHTSNQTCLRPPPVLPRQERGRKCGSGLPPPEKYHPELQQLPPIFIGGAISPNLANNPMFAVREYNPEHKNIVDSLGYYLPLAQSNNFASRRHDMDITADDWAFEYRFTDAYNVQETDPNTLTHLVTRISDARSREKAIFWNYYFGSPNFPHMECIMTSLGSYDGGYCPLDVDYSPKSSWPGGGQKGPGLDALYA
mmetsp:Transcript_13867/g.32998  ORF Transcript_13867/g.32998 Transcript_13867/m.32998 type:complete len:244 (-) Transcript_13867:389-1120(-)